MTTRNAIIIKGLSKRYPRDITPAKVASFMLFPAGGKLVLDNLNLVVPRGQVVGLIGPNGAGKSTLLKIIAGQCNPTAGTVSVDGRVLAILQISTGLQEELTGRDNILRLAPLYGMSEESIKNKLDDIISFAELGRFIDYPVRTYSAGMRARLAFSIVTSAECDVLLIDEALSVGDPSFVQRCRARIRSICSNGQTVVIVSHSMDAIRELCDRVLWLEGGTIVDDDTPQRVIERYRVSMLTRAEQEFARRFAARTRGASYSENIELLDLWAATADRGRVTVIPVGSQFSINADLSTTTELQEIWACCEFTRVDGVLVAREKSSPIILPSGKSRINVSFNAMRLGRFPYEVKLSLFNKYNELCGEMVTVIAVHDMDHSYNSSYYQPIEWYAESTLAGESA